MAGTQPDLLAPRGRWAVQRRDDGAVVGGLGIRLLPPYEDDLEMSWQVAPEAWGQGYATEGGRALIAWAFTQDAEELFAVARPNNVCAIAIAMARRLGMAWVGETTKHRFQRAGAPAGQYVDPLAGLGAKGEVSARRTPGARRAGSGTRNSVRRTVDQEGTASTLSPPGRGSAR
ncbi:GNAT family N-acetyltransferase [Kitasatospora herbaricolor]|uniref:GNAT family N-acetyltransferase n=1 Tax=Kitasatospora herbaricolor TaxID=68217 RepID=UPI0036D90CAD